MNFIWKHVRFFWLFKMCALRLLHRGSLKYRFYFENSHDRLKLWVISQAGATNSDNSAGMMRLKGQKSIFTELWITFWWLSKPVGKSRSRKYPQGFEKTIIDNILKSLEFQKATHTCAFCFCPGVSRSFASGTSPKWIDRKGLGKRRTGTRQDHNDDNGDDDDDEDNADDDDDD